MALRSKHAFGSEANIDIALEQGLIDSYDILFLREGKIGWIDADGNKVILEDKKQVVSVDSLPENGNENTVYIYNSKFYFWNGSEFTTPTDETGLNEEIVDAKINSAIQDVTNETRTYTDEKIEIAKKVKFEILNKPVGTLVNYNDKEIRVMCPENTIWTKQEVGATGNQNMHYMEFRAYAPNDAASFKEGDRGVIIDEMFDFNDDFAGTDEFGRKYSVCWFALASYNDENDTWTYFGKNSTVEKYIGWDYVVEWYNSDGVLIASDNIRINLSNENCHFSSEPYYVSNVVKTVNAYTDEQIANAVSIVEF